MCEVPRSALLFSEGNALYLWQIRHIPNDRKTLLRLTFFGVAFSLVAITCFPAISFAAAQVEKAEPAKSEASEKATPAEEFLDRVRQELPNHRSTKASLTQIVSIGEQKFKITGQYLSSGQKLKLDYLVAPDQGAVGGLMEVCDGKEMWSMLQLPDKLEVTQRNIQQIMAAAEAANSTKASDETIRADLGMGGIATLLASLNRMMTFDGMKAEEVEGQSITTIQGRWKPQILQTFPKDRDNSLPAFVPDLVRISVNTKTMFPEKILYLKKVPQSKKFKSLVSLEFRDIEFDVPVDESVFVFQVPKGIIPVDVTKQFIDRLTPPAASPATVPAAN